MQRVLTHTSYNTHFHFFLQAFYCFLKKIFMLLSVAPYFLEQNVYKFVLSHSKVHELFLVHHL